MTEYLVRDDLSTVAHGTSNAAAVSAASRHCESTGRRVELVRIGTDGQRAILGHCVRLANAWDLTGYRVTWVWQTQALGGHPDLICDSLSLFGEVQS